MVPFSNLDVIQWFEAEFREFSPFLQFLIIIVILSKRHRLVDHVWKVQKYCFDLSFVLIHVCFEFLDSFRNGLCLFQKALGVAAFFACLGDLLSYLVSSSSEAVSFGKCFPPLRVERE